MSNKLWMPLYVADYLGDTGHLSTTEHGAYMLLIMHYWQNSGLPAEDGKLARICRMTPRDWGKSRETIAAFFDEAWRHGRIDFELAKAEDVSNKRQAAGKAGARKRYSKRVANANDLPKQTHRQSHTQLPKEDSEAKASAASRPGEDLAKAFWDEGKSYLVSTGMTLKEAGSLLGLWRRDWGEAEVIATLLDAKRLAVSDPRSWCPAALKRRAPGVLRPTEIGAY